MRHINNHRANQRAARAFTLVEMLVVIALSVLLLGLLFGPLINSFNFTRKTQALVQAQDAARFSLERMNREISEAAYVFDNRNLPVYFPLEDPDNLKRENGNGQPMQYPVDPNGVASSIVPIIGSKIDFIPAGTLPATPTQITDPTTGGSVDGAALRFPLATGTRIFRYFVGLRRNTNAAGTAQEYYRNVYEFPRTDSDLNPFTLYRVEFDANDPNLFDIAKIDSSVANDAGFNDPNFFYNTKTAANGLTYAQNWRALSSPIIQSERADVLFWSKNNNKVYTAGAPAQLPISFGAGVIVGDTATPGFLTNDVSDLAGAVPSLYTSRYGQWTLPYTVTVYRGVTDNVLNDSTSGSLSITIDTRFGANGVVEPVVTINQTSATPNVLKTDEANLRYCFTSSGKLFVQTPNLTFIVDPTRGRVETGIPPIQGNSGTRAPKMVTASGVVDIPTLAETGGTYTRHIGDPLQSIFRLNTRDHRAGQTNDPATGAVIDPSPNPSDPDYIVPSNQGLLVAGLFERHYYPNIPPFAGQPLAPPGTPAGLSPFEIFTQNGGATAGIALVSGSERVMGPSATQGITNQNVNLVTYSRSSDGNAIVPREAGVLSPLITGQPQYFTAFAANSPQYALEADFAGAHRNPILLFDVLPGQRQPKQYTSGSLNGQWFADLIRGENITGLPASFATDNRQRELRVTYLWQNNYARNASGEPIDVSHRPATKVPVAGDTSGARSPEADVVKVNYSTRALVNVTLGVRIYDPNSGQPVNVQLADKIVVRNLGR